MLTISKKIAWKTICYLFSDKKLALKKFFRSQYRPVPEDYWVIGKNPILTCLLDQIEEDWRLSMKYPNQEALLNKIIETLETGQARFPRGFNLMSTEE